MPYSPILYGERPSPPSTWQRTIISQATAREQGLIPSTTTVVSYATTWHHNIPWKTLRDTWNIIYALLSLETVEKVFNLYADGNGTVLTKSALFKTLKLGREAIGPLKTNATTASYELWMKRHSEQGIISSLSAEKQMSASDRENLAMIVAWQRWNIVEGPKESVRVEDPGSDDFDDFRFIDPTYASRFEKVYILFEALQLLEKQYESAKTGPYDPAVIAGWDAAFNAALEKAQGLANEPLVNFQLKHWKLVSFGGKSTAKVDSQDYALVAKANRGTFGV
jgi:hypothetical protein